jgi:hypothetical protein
MIRAVSGVLIGIVDCASVSELVEEKEKEEDKKGSTSKIGGGDNCEETKRG